MAMEVGIVSAPYRLPITNRAVYASWALPPGGFLDLVEVGSRCSTTRVAHLYSGVPISPGQGQAS